MDVKGIIGVIAVPILALLVVLIVVRLAFVKGKMGRAKTDAKVGSLASSATNQNRRLVAEVT